MNGFFSRLKLAPSLSPHGSPPAPPVPQIFPIPPICTTLSKETRTRIVYGVERASGVDQKLQDFQGMQDELQTEMKHKFYLQHYPITSFLATRFSAIANISFAVCIAINYLLITGINTSTGTNTSTDS